MNTAKHANVKLFFMEFPDPTCRRCPPPQRPESLLALAHITGPMIQGANSSSPTPELMSMSSSMWRYTREFVASLMDGTGLQPKTDPRPVVKQMMLHPPATRPVIETGSWPGVSMNTKPRVVMGSP